MRLVTGIFTVKMELSVCDWLLDLHSRWTSLYATGCRIYSQDGTLYIYSQDGTRSLYATGYWIYSQDGTFQVEGGRHKITNAETEGRLVTAYLRV